MAHIQLPSLLPFLSLSLSLSFSDAHAHYAYSRTLTNTSYAQHLPGGFRAPSLDEEFVKEYVARKRDACVIKAVMSILSISQLRRLMAALYSVSVNLD
jgi:hypothetical protein